ncbi:hypothetical protein ACNAN0_02950 [Agrilactobacillus fermenti]|uniref:hypothetical protein n=1 Tax=Agrilactobacillus fermenti TaxID=2586909 RepID=UPI001E610201|nr:hypothetical protein [Agrilactobacillus fermenti]MCD2255543.1 hypothetical protein [Agrilactobacillus fermenti]
MANLGQLMLTAAVLVGIPIILTLQYILGYKQASKGTAAIVPILYVSLVTILTLAHRPWHETQWLFVLSQWIVGYFFYFVYEFGRNKSLAKIGDLSHPVTDKL